jgi:hypothetical protein
MIERHFTSFLQTWLAPTRCAHSNRPIILANPDWQTDCVNRTVIQSAVLKTVFRLDAGTGSTITPLAAMRGVAARTLLETAI